MIPQFPNPNITITTREDVADLHRLVNSAYRGDSSRKGWTTEANLLDGQRTSEKLLLEMMEEPEAVILKYADPENDLLQACVYLKNKSGKLYLGMLTVNPELQARGIGKQLLAAAEFYAEQVNATAIQMTVISVRSELIAWYERHGFRKTGQTEPFPADPEFGLPKQALEFIVMEKDLS
ncbi:MAG: GNAT family N-acetyltransferase [Bacteroidetes bacterium]|nr:GNAT family N-acetyltransferase [Bacteroidota bacterium]